MDQDRKILEEEKAKFERERKQFERRKSMATIDMMQPTPPPSPSTRLGVRSISGSSVLDRPNGANLLKKYGRGMGSTLVKVTDEHISESESDSDQGDTRGW